MKYAIEVKNIVKTFGSVKAVKDVSFFVEEGEIFAFLGPNGAGKTTLIKMLTTLLTPTSGSALLNGFDIVKNPDDVRRSFGIVFQDSSVDTELTAEENMYFHSVLYGMPKALAKERIQELMILVELWDRRKDLVKNFSGGMKRRLEIARGLLHHPRILFLDEPTLGLDPQTRNLMWEYVKRLNEKEKLTVFFTTHYMEEADRAADRIAIINNGKILLEGSPKVIKDQTGSATLEDAFLTLTGKKIHDESSDMDQRRLRNRAWGR